MDKKSGNTLKLIGVAASVAFVLAFFLAWVLFGSSKGGAVKEEEPPAPQNKTLGEADLEPFLAAARSRDFKAMSAIGKELFRKGDDIPDRELLFAEYAVDSFPPYQVYAFLTSNTGEYVYRVMLTVTDDNKVESFMAEEMPVVK